MSRILVLGASGALGHPVATSNDDDRTIGKRLCVHGRESFSLASALERFLCECHPQIKVTRLRLWQAKLIARFAPQLRAVVELIGFFEQVGEMGYPAEANALLGSPRISLDDWIEMQHGRAGHGDR